ncbi:hypothetical protein SLA2020_205950 [Shorea laevis]
MDVTASAKWLCELGMDELNIIHGGHMNSVAELRTAQDVAATLQVARPSLSSNSYNSCFSDLKTHNTTTFSGSSIETSFERPAKLIKTSSFNSTITTHHGIQKPSSPPCTSQILSFEKSGSLKPEADLEHLCYTSNPKYVTATDGLDYENTIYVPKVMKRTHSITKTPYQVQDHIMAERNRREKLNQRFIALSGIVPGLKKMDKASVLGEAIRYVKQLQERLKVLEEQTTKRTVESVVLVKKSSSCDDDNSDGHSNIMTLPEMEASVCGKDVLIRIHCEKQKGFLVKILSEIEKLHLSIVNSSVLPFGSTLDITVIAQKDSEFDITVKDFVKELRKALLNFM